MEAAEKALITTSADLVRADISVELDQNAMKLEASFYNRKRKLENEKINVVEPAIARLKTTMLAQDRALHQIEDFCNAAGISIEQSAEPFIWFAKTDSDPWYRFCSIVENDPTQSVVTVKFAAEKNNSYVFKSALRDILHIPKDMKVAVTNGDGYVNQFLVKTPPALGDTGINLSMGGDSGIIIVPIKKLMFSEQDMEILCGKRCARGFDGEFMCTNQ